MSLENDGSKMPEFLPGYDEMSYLQQLAVMVGTTEPALRLLFSLLIGYPLGIVHRFTLFGNVPVFQHLFFSFFGLLLGYFNFGWDILHSVCCVLVLYLTLLILGGTVASLIFSFVFQTGYLLIGYWYTETEKYDIKWSMPHCVLTLRLIGLTFDVYDGKREPASLSSEQSMCALKSTPNLLEIFGHSFFPGSFLVGPQFSMRRYLAFINGKFRESSDSLPRCVNRGFLRGSLGLVYVAFYMIGLNIFSDEYPISPAFVSLPYWRRLFWYGIWGKLMMCKYVASFLISEGVCIVTGLSYNAKDQNGNVLWDGCANIKIRKYEFATQFSQLVSSFNTNTNAWIAQYVYKRLKFVGNRSFSQMCSLLYLAVWHGLHSCYYVCFIFEYFVMRFEREWNDAVYSNASIKAFLTHPLVIPLKLVFLKVYFLIFLGYCMAPFNLLKHEKWFEGYYNVAFFGHMVFCSSIFWLPYLKKAIRSRDKIE